MSMFRNLFPRGGTAKGLRSFVSASSFQEELPKGTHTYFVKELTFDPENENLRQREILMKELSSLTHALRNCHIPSSALTLRLFDDTFPVRVKIN